ncbi:MAG: hypothetical protein B6D46_00175 [Polyangiaceae bacterium UTPRO1]|jgi:hypothetical protein|nr:hypothetical protein [Myxococcales bacterium]OQY69391.1 MAG: hypothetical protein B6D46_00175 [Polyangiaceae bacterium UTPRO1]
MTTHCWRCEHAIDETDRYRRACGEGQSAAIARYYRPLRILVLAAAVLGPLAIVPIMRTPRLSFAAEWAASVGLVLWHDTRTLLDV